MITARSGYNNWYEIQFDTDAASACFDVRFHNQSVEHMSFQDAADYTAKLIGDNFENIYLGMSGGIDSEFVAEILHRNAVKFTPVIGVCLGTGSLDYFAAVDWCERHNLEPKILYFDMDDRRLTGNLIKMIRQYKAYSLGAVMLMCILDWVETEGGVLLHGDPQLVCATQEDMSDDYYKIVGDEDFTVYWFELLANLSSARCHPGGFFFYTPEIVASYIREFNVGLHRVVAKRRLFGDVVPFKVKTNPAIPFSVQMIEKITKLYGGADLPLPMASWPKDKLYNLISERND